MDVRSPLYQNIALIVAGVLFLNPIVATAAQLAVDQAAGGNTSLTQAGNGVPVVNIATPNGSGLSHNKFTDYNVGQQGLILNNSTERLQSSQLGGLIIGNSNLKNGTAGLILNEVTGGNASQLKGYTEVAGRSAAVIVANPHGITCDGCGFINTPRVTLTTGTPVVEGGRLQRFDVDGGQVSIEGQGLNADNVDQFDLITRSAKLNAELYANKLNIITGRNAVDATTLAATAKADDGSDKPLLAIDSSALGGMYAGAIRLVGTEQGVGVKLAGDMAASAGDIQIDANGKLSLAQTSASGNLALKAAEVALTGKTYAAGKADIGAQNQIEVQQSLAAAGDIQLEAGQVLNQGVIEAGIKADNSRTEADLSLKAQQVRNAGTLIGNRQLQVKASQRLDNQGGTLSAKGATQISAGQVDNRAGRVLADRDLKLSASALDNRQGGLLHSQGAADMQVAGALQNQQGKLVSQGALTLGAGRLVNQGGQVLSIEALSLQAEGLDNGDAGVISTQADAHITAGSLRNAQAGEISAAGTMQLDAQRLDNSAKGIISSAQALTVKAEQLDNRGQGVISGSETLSLAAASLDNSTGGRIESQGDLRANLGQLKQQGGALLSQGQLTLEAGAVDNSQAGVIFGRQGLQVQADQVDNRDKGRISSQGALTALLKGLDQRGGGQFVSQEALSLDLAGGRLNNSQQGLLATPGGLLLTNVAAIDNSQGGEISSDQGFSLLTGELNNDAGRIISAAALELRIAQALLNGNGGLLDAGKTLQLRAASLNNSGAGQISSQGDMRLFVAGALSNAQQGLIASQAVLHIEADALDNQERGELSSGAALAITGRSLDNRGGLIASDTVLELDASERLDNSQGGVLTSAAALDLEAGQLSNHDGGLIQSDGEVQAKVKGAFDNRAGSLLSGRDLLLVSGALDNRGGSLSSAGALQVRGSSLNASVGGRVVANGAVDIQLAERFDLSAGGRLLSGADLLLRANVLDNHDLGLIFAKGDTSLEASQVDNRQGGEISSKGDLSVQVDELDNREQGRLIAEAGLKLVADRVLNSALGALSAAQKMQVQTRVLANAGGRVLSGAALELSATQLDNQAQGRISAAADLSLLTEQLDNQQRGEVRSGGTLTLHAKAVDAHDQGLIAAAGAATVVVDEALDLSQGGQLIGEAALGLQVGSLSTHQQGLVAAKGDLQVEASNIDNGAGGEMSTQGSLTLTADQLDNQDAGRVIAQAGLNATVARVNNQRSGVLASNAALLLHAKQIDNSVGGALSGAQLLTLQADSLDNQGGGRVLSGGAASIVLQQLNNSEAGLLSSRGDLLLQGNRLNNRAGSILVDGKGKVQADSLDSSSGGQLSSLGDLDVDVASLDQHEGGELLSKGLLDLHTTTLDNRDGLVSALGLNIQAERLSNQGGELSSAGSLSIEGEHLDNSGAGKVLADGALSLKVAQLLNQAKGVLSGANGLSLQGTVLNNSAGGRLLSQGAIDLALTGQLNNREGGSLLAQGPLRIKAASLDNAEAGLLSSQQEMALLLAGQLDNQGGALMADGALNVQAQGLDNRQKGVLSGKGNLKLKAQQIDNRTGHIVSDARLDLDAERLDNSQGQVAGKGDLKLELKQLVQQGGALLSEGTLDLEADSIDNSQAGLIAATQGLAIRAASLNNSAKGEISSQGAVGLDVDDLNNSTAGLVLAGSDLRLTVKRLLNHSLGLISGRTGLVLQADSLDNSQGGTLTSEQGLDLQVSGLLDNYDQGALLSEGTLQVRAGTLNNAAGVLSSAGELTLDGGALNNQGGKLVTDAKLTLDSSSLDNSQGGRISARQALNIETGTLDNQQQGLINGAADVTVQVARLDNHGKGRIAGKGAVQVSATALDQHDGGELISESALTLDLQGGDLDNSGQGLIATPGALLLKNLGKVDNSAGGEISSSQGFLLKARELNNSAGRVISAQDLQLQITQLLKNSLKGVLSAGSLEVTAAGLDNSAAGVLASKGDLQVKLTGKLDNHDLGTLSAAQALTVAAAELDNGNAGLLASGADLQIKTGTLNNQGGSLLSQAAFELESDDLDNRSGVISSRQALGMVAGAVDNRDNGLITSADSLEMTATRLDSSQGGELSAKKDLQLTVTELIQRQGRLIGEAGVRLDLKGGNLDNRGGLLTANGPLSLQALGKLDNRNGGEISSIQSYQLRASAIDNGEQGRIISAGKLGLDVGTGDLRNAAGGLISGWQGVDIAAGSLDNSARGTVSSRDGALTVKLNGSQRALNNSDEGALVSKGALEIEAASLNNSVKGIVSSGSDLDLRLSAALDNSGSGLIDSQGTLTANAGAVHNNTGQIGSAQAASINAASLDNRAGQLASDAALDLTLTGNLLNGQQGKLASAGPLVLKANAIDNQSGNLISQNLLDLTASSLNNAGGGTIAARNGLSLLLSGALNNTNEGLIHSQQGNLGIRAQGIDNSAGSLSSQGDLLLALDGKLDNQNGQIQSRGGNLDLRRSTSVDNRGGVLNSLSGWLKLVSTGLFDNDGGTTQAQTLDIETQGLNNRGGHISALAGNTTIDLGNTTFNNQGGGLYAHQLLDVITGDFNNQGEASGQGGKVAAERIDFGLAGALNNAYGIVESASSLSLTSTGLDNRFGSLRALGSSGDTRITASSLDNRDGRIETANTNLVLDTARLQSSGGSILHVGTGNFGLSAAQVMGAGGDLSTNGLLSLSADSWTNSGVLQAGRLVLNIGNFTQTATGQLLASQSLVGSGSTWINDGLLASDGSLSLDLTGAYSGAGQVTSLGDLSLQAASLDLASAARISGGGVSSVSSTGSLTNRGRLTSASSLTVSANTLNNYGTLGGSETLRVVAPNLLNENGLIFSGDDMALRVDNFTNQYADVYSLGALNIARDDAQAAALSVNNVSSVIESAADISINSGVLSNRSDVFSIGRKLVSGFITVVCRDCSGDNYVVEYFAREIYKSEAVSVSPASSILAGRNFDFVGGNFENKASVVSALGDVNIAAQDFSNLGAVNGTIERTRVYLASVTDGTVRRFTTGTLIDYNLRNNPASPGFYYIAKSGDVRLAIPDKTFDDGDGNISTRYEDSITGSWVSDYLLDHLSTMEPQKSKYDPDNLLPLPSRLDNYRLVSDLEELSPDGVAYPSIVQAGGSVFLNAVNNLENGQIREDAAIQNGANRIADTRALGTGKTTVVSLNAQLPPNLQQQQVNPLTLPGFTLPQGENGLFRLSSQQTQNATAKQAQAGFTDRTLGGRSIALDQQERSQAAVAAQGRSFVIATQNGQTVATLAATDRQLQASAANLQASSSAATVVADVKPLPATIAGQASTAPSNGPIAVQPTRPSVVASAISGGLPELSGDPSQASLAPSVQASAMATPGVEPSAVVPDFSIAPPVQHKYLIETNPALTDLKQFVSSDYLLGNLGYDPDQAQKRLGDGLYEQRLVREAIVARTGQRYLAGLTSDDAMFRYLMDNAIASKDALGLSLGVTLSAEQVAALTHDIVWLEEHEVAGEKVLVPVLYLAQAEGRLAANGALIQGRDVTLISGGELVNQGTLRASDNLTATAGNISNSGLVEAGNRLQLLATDSIRNAQGGIIAGRDVSLIALTGDVSNERSVTRHETSYGSRRTIQDFVDSAARIEAANDLSIIAGRDVSNLGGVLDSRGDLAIEAGRDVTISSVQETVSQARGNKYLNERVTQMGAEVSAGRDLDISAGRDLGVIASRLEAGRDVALAAGNDALIASAANESHFLSKSKKLIRQTDQVRQQSSEIAAGGDLSVSAKSDLVVSASKLEAGDEAYLVAGENLALLSAEDYDYSLYQKKKKGSFGRKSFKRNEDTKVTNIGSEISTGGDLTLVSEGDQLYQKAHLESDNDLSLISGGEITFEGVKDLKQKSREKSKSSFAWQSAKGKGKTDETLRQSELIAQGDLVIQAVDGLNIDIKQVNRQSVSQTIDAMVKADPNLAWLKEAEARGDVDWRRVKEVHDSFKYSSSGLGAGASMVIAIVVAYFTAGAMSGLVANGATAAGASTAATSAGGAWAAGSGIGWANAAVTAGLTGMTSNAAISTINNRGNLGAVVKDITSEDALRGYAVAGVTAGLTNGLYDGWVGTETGTAGAIQNGGKVIASGGGLSTLEGIGRFAGNQLLQNGTSTVLDRALGGDSSFSDALRNSLANTFAAAGFNLIGDVTAKGQLNLADGSPAKIAMHAVMGGLAAEAAGGDFKTGALAAGVNEALVGHLSDWYGQMDPEQKKSLLVMNSQVIGVLAAAVQGGDEKALQVGSQVAGTATQYNHLDHGDSQSFADAMESCGPSEACQRDLWQQEKYAEESAYNDSFVENVAGGTLARDKMGQVAAGLEVLLAMTCSTPTCDGYKLDLIESALNNYATLSEIAGEWSPTFERLGLLSGVGSTTGAQGLRPRPAGTPLSVGVAQFEKAVAYLASVKAGTKTTGVVDQTAGSIKNVNPGYPEAGRTHNCVNCSIATDATLAGNPASALPINHTKGVPLSVLEKQFGSKFGPITAPENIAQQMASSGNGARGIVFGSYGPGQPGHVFNVVNQNGVVRFLDGQTGRSANLSDFKTLQLLRTN
ncbi:Filamentous hemagglutinin, intein-containing [Pseudomonas sp. 8Z]|uniref:two-partner secretion domain-containing protein n=1 Tax=Pseudomonas sp. 8Z TaxID=2653166 RepID=UPI0012F07953|nr:filamentous hemagglutinin N-terminal domain-containing protein [Pseudomonas sp. 8Z]VXC34576.1 Filamentous hemagglutinin, intein-containing [Pseudomonas sp. 8Z]